MSLRSKPNTIDRNAAGFASSTKRTVLIIAIAASLLTAWSSLAPLNSAVLADGFVRAEKANKPVQHLRAGKIAQVFVTPGQSINTDEKLMKLDTTEEEAALLVTLNDLLRLKIQQDVAQSRLAAGGKPQFDESTLVLARRLDAMHELKLASALFLDELDQYDDQQEILDERLIQISRAREADQAYLTATDSQLAASENKLVAMQTLKNGQYVAEATLKDLEAEVSQLLAKQIGLSRRIEEKNSSLNQIRLEKELLATSVRGTFAETLSRATAELPVVEGKIQQLQRAIENATLTSSHAGVVAEMKYRSPGATIAAGEVLMVILPTEESLVVEARIQPNDIDQLMPGQICQVRLSAYNSRTTEMVNAEILNISADRRQDADGFFYSAELSIDENSLSRNQLKLAAGMPVEVFILGADRTLMEYLLEPVTRGIDRSLRES